MSENPNSVQRISWPGWKSARRRLLLIALVLFPITWVVFASLVGSWTDTSGPEEAMEHRMEALFCFVLEVGVIFWASLLPKSWPGTRSTLRRLFLITLVLLPCIWAINAILVGGWNLISGPEESVRHQAQAIVGLILGVAVVFWWSLLPKFQWLFNARVVRRLLIVLAWSATIVALLYGEENWRGRHAWNKYRKELEARGEELDYRTFIPKPVPDEQNFAATPFVKSWFVKDNSGQFAGDKLWNDNYSPASRMISSTAFNKPRHLLDLVAWAMAFDAARSGQTNSDQEFKSDKFDLESRAKAASAVLGALRTSETHLAELRAASQRPSSRYPVVYDMDNPWGILLPHLSNVKAACLRLQLKASAELAIGRSDDALVDVKLAFDVADSVKDEPFLISPLVRFACMHITVQPIWEGLAEHRWSDAQLQELQARLQRYDWVAALKHPFDGERAAGILTADLLAAGKYRLADLVDDNSTVGGSAANAFGRIAPRGWYEMEKLNYFRLYQLQMDGAFDMSQKRIYPQRLESNSKALERAFAGRNPVTTICTRHQLLAAIMLPALGNIPPKAAQAQTVVDEAVLACALERYRLANGQFPEKLESLVPRFVSQLPQDVITGESYKYRRTDDPSSQSSSAASGAFVLYSIGWDEKDDGGTPGKELFDKKQGDWVWQYPAK